MIGSCAVITVGKKIVCKQIFNETVGTGAK
jgi:hypothetical protein